MASGSARAARTTTVLDRRRGAPAVGPARVRHAALQRPDPASATDPDRREHHAFGDGGRGRGAANFARLAGCIGGEPAVAGTRFHRVLRRGARLTGAASGVGQHRSVRSDFAARRQRASAAGRAAAAVDRSRRSRSDCALGRGGGRQLDLEPGAEHVRVRCAAADSRRRQDPVRAHGRSAARSSAGDRQASRPARRRNGCRARPAPHSRRAHPQPCCMGRQAAIRDAAGNARSKREQRGDDHARRRARVYGLSPFDRDRLGGGHRYSDRHRRCASHAFVHGSRRLGPRVDHARSGCRALHRAYSDWTDAQAGARRGFRRTRRSADVAGDRLAGNSPGDAGAARRAHRAREAATQRATGAAARTERAACRGAGQQNEGRISRDARTRAAQSARGDRHRSARTWSSTRKRSFAARCVTSAS